MHANDGVGEDASEVKKRPLEEVTADQRPGRSQGTAM